ncbi:MAG: protein translocase subunit SecF [Acidimicrobiales bacterium]
MTAARGGAFGRLYRGETSFDFAGRWRRWLGLSGTVIMIGLVSLAVQGLHFSIDFKGGTVWEVPSSASVSQVRAAITKVSPDLGQSIIQLLRDPQTGQRTVEVSAAAKTTGNANEVNNVATALADVSHVNPNKVNINAVGPSWGNDVTGKAIKAVIIFLVVVTIYIWFRFEGKMAIAALVALVHDILVTVGIYSLSGLQVSPDTVIAFLTILGYSLYDTIVVFDKVQENTRGVASTNRLTYSETVNLSMNQVLARSLNTSFVAIIPILSILVIGAGILGAPALSDFGLALFIGLTTGAYSSIFIASPLLAVLKEREPRYAEIRRRVGSTPRRLTPRAAAVGEDAVATVLPARRQAAPAPRPAPAEPPVRVGSPADDGDEPSWMAAAGSVRGRPATPVRRESRRPATGGEGVWDGPGEAALPGPPAGGGAADSLPVPAPPRPGNRPPPRPRKKKRR